MDITGAGLLDALGLPFELRAAARAVQKVGGPRSRRENDDFESEGAVSRSENSFLRVFRMGFDISLRSKATEEAPKGNPSPFGAVSRHLWLAILII